MTQEEYELDKDLEIMNKSYEVAAEKRLHIGCADCGGELNSNDKYCKSCGAYIIWNR